MFLQSESLPVCGLNTSLAFDNLPLVTQLEKNRRSRTHLIGIFSSHVELSGRLSDGSCWNYSFAESGFSTVFTWTVYGDGRIEETVPDEFQRPLVPFHSLRDLLSLNSNEAMIVAIRNGAQDFLSRYPDAFAAMKYSMLRVSPVCRITVRNPDNLCNIEFWLNTRNAQILAKDLSCLNCK